MGMLNLFLTWEGKLSVFQNKYHVSWVLVIYDITFTLRGISSIPNLLRGIFNHEGTLNFAKCSSYLLRWYYDSYPSFAHMLYHIYWFVHVELSFHTREKSIWSWCIILVYHWIWFASILLGNFTYMFIKNIGL